RNALALAAAGTGGPSALATGKIASGMASAMSRTKTPGSTARPGGSGGRAPRRHVDRNAHASRVKNHIYAIEEITPDWEVRQVKVGLSSQPVNAAGESLRALQQINKWIRKGHLATGHQYITYILDWAATRIEGIEKEIDWTVLRDMKFGPGSKHVLPKPY